MVGSAGTAHSVVGGGEETRVAGVTDGASRGCLLVGLGASRAISALASSSCRDGANRAQTAIRVCTRELASIARLTSSEAGVGASSTGASLTSGCSSQTEGVGGAGLALASGSGELARVASRADGTATVRLVSSRAGHTAARSAARGDGVDGAVLARATSFGKVSGGAEGAGCVNPARRRSALASVTLSGTVDDRVRAERASLANAVAVREGAGRARFADGLQRCGGRIGLGTRAAGGARAASRVLSNSVRRADLASTAIGEGSSRTKSTVGIGSGGCSVTARASLALGGTSVGVSTVRAFLAETLSRGEVSSVTLVASLLVAVGLATGTTGVAHASASARDLGIGAILASTTRGGVELTDLARLASSGASYRWNRLLATAAEQAVVGASNRGVRSRGANLANAISLRELARRASNASVAAGATSGTAHSAAACARLGNLTLRAELALGAIARERSRVTQRAASGTTLSVGLGTARALNALGLSCAGEVSRRARGGNATHAEASSGAGIAHVAVDKGAVGARGAAASAGGRNAAGGAVGARLALETEGSWAAIGRATSRTIGLVATRARAADSCASRGEKAGRAILAKNAIRGELINLASVAAAEVRGGLLANSAREACASNAVGHLVVGAGLAGAADNRSLTAGARLAEVAGGVAKVGGAGVACAAEVLDVALGTAEEANVVELEQSRTGENLRNDPLEVEVERGASKAGHVNVQGQRARVGDALTAEVLVGRDLEEVGSCLVEEGNNEGTRLSASRGSHVVSDTVVENGEDRGHVSSVDLGTDGHGQSDGAGASVETGTCNNAAVGGSNCVEVEERVHSEAGGVGGEGQERCRNVGRLESRGEQEARLETGIVVGGGAVAATCSGGIGGCVVISCHRVALCSNTREETRREEEGARQGEARA